MKARLELILTASLLALSSPICAAPDPDNAHIADAVRRAMPDTTISAVRPAPVPGLVEVVAGRNVLYTDPQGRFLVIGSIYDLATAQDLTAQRRNEITRISWDELPAADAIRFGHGAQKVAVFLDPDCPWCRRLYEDLHKVDGIEVHAFLFPIEALHAGARDKALRILCAPDPRAALASALQGRALTGPKDCAGAAARIDTVMRFAQAHGVSGTPMFVAPDGRVHGGYLTPQALHAWLEAPAGAAPSQPATPSTTRKEHP